MVGGDTLKFSDLSMTFSIESICSLVYASSVTNMKSFSSGG